MTSRSQEFRVVVLGGGISGLAAAFFLTRGHAAPGGATAVTVLEADDRAGGKIRTDAFAGVALDSGPDSFLARVPAGIALSEALGLGGELVAPGTGKAWLWTRGRMRPLPPGLVLGAPADLIALARSRALSPRGTARTALDLVLPARPGSYATVDGDRALGQFLRSRFGAEAQLRLIDPLLGGINAGRTETMSMDVVAPQLATAAQRGRSLISALREYRTALGLSAQGAPPPTPPPVFLTVAGGLTRVVEALVAAVEAGPGNEFCPGEAATRIRRTGRSCWEIETSAGRQVKADAVVIAVPAPAACRLLAEISPAAAGVLGTIDYSSVALTTLAYPTSALAAPLNGSGFLVPRIEGRLMTACTWMDSKWPHLATPDQVILRVSSGRAGDVRAMSLEDGSLVDRLHDELTQSMGIRSDPTIARVHRWVDAFPQYEVGHLGRMSSVGRRLAIDAPGITLAGAFCRGVGLSTCIAGAQRAAEWVAGYLAGGPDTSI